MRSVTTLGEALDRSGLRREHVARRCGVKPWTVSKWIAGVHAPEEAQQLALAALLNLEVDELVELLPSTTKAAA